MAVFIVFTILLALGFLSLTGFIVWKWIKGWDKATLIFLILIDCLILAAMIGCALNWGGAIHY